jgi:ATP-dependent protease ClpP protease subunit
MRVFNDASKNKLGAMFAIRNQADASKPLEILVYEDIGKDPWTGEGFGAKECVEKLTSEDQTRELHLKVNSRGGLVSEGMPIYHAIKSWTGKTIGFNDGVAASMATILLMACDEVRMPKACEFLIHEAWASFYKEGNAEELRKAADEACGRLEFVSDMLSGVYAEKTGRPKDECRRMMKSTTLMNGEQAKAMGFADTLTDGDPLYNFSPEDITTIKAMCRAGSEHITNGGKPPTTKGTVMDRLKIVALLKEHGQAVDEKATDEQLFSQLQAALSAKKQEPQANNKDVIELKAALQSMQAERDKERKDRIERAVDQCVLDDKINASEREFWVKSALADEAALAIVQAREPKPPGVATRMPPLETKASVPDVLKRFDILGKDNRNAAERGYLFEGRRADIMGYIMNAAGDNTIAAGLQRQVILQESARAFALNVIQLGALSTVFENVPLEGTNKVEVPFFDLETAASTDFVQANGYVIGTTTTDVREVEVNKRKYQAFSFPSSTLRRQPFYKTAELLRIKAEKLGADVVADVLSIVTNENFGAAAIAEAAAAFDENDVADLRTACNQANWPKVGRSLFLDSEYDGSLVKSGAFKADAFGGREVMLTGNIPQYLGFGYYESPNIPANSENLKGFAAFKSAIMVATAPIQPAPAVLKNLATYQVYVEPNSGIALEYREYGDTQKDTEAHTIEANYGYAKGNASALKRITS